MLDSQSVVPKARRSPWPLVGWSYLFTMLGFPLHEAAHALVYYVQGIGFTMTLNRVFEDQLTVAGLLAGPLASLLVAWLGLRAVSSGKLHPTLGIAIALGQTLHRPPLHLGMLFFGLHENDEALAAQLLDVPHAALVIPSFLLYVGTVIVAARQMRARGYAYWTLVPAFVAVAAGVMTILMLDHVLFGV